MNLALDGATAKSSSTFLLEGVHPDNVWDGSMYSCWLSIVEDYPWIILDIVEQFQVMDVIVRQRSGKIIAILIRVN